MRLLPIVLIFISAAVFAEEDCVFDESVYIAFINKYSTESSNSKIEPDSSTLIVNRNNEKIIVKGGGCVHLGVAIELRDKQTYTEQQFLQRTLDLSIEFGSWLINTNALEDSIREGRYHEVEGSYFIEVDAMTVFSATYDSQGTINIDFYIN